MRVRARVYMSLYARVCVRARSLLRANARARARALACANFTMPTERLQATKRVATYFSARARADWVRRPISPRRVFADLFFDLFLTYF